jgi:transposase-like protein
MVTTKSKLNEETIQKISSCISMGMSIENSARYGGVTPRTLRNWMKEAETSDDPMLQKLTDAIDHARSQFESDMVLNWLSCLTG